MTSYYKFYLLLVLGFFQITSLIAQEENAPYYLSLKREILYIGSGLTTTTSAYLLQRKTPHILASNLVRPDVSDFDEVVFGNNSVVAANFSDQTLFSSLGLPVLFLANKKSRKDIGTIGLLYLETMLINQGITDIAKVASRRPRPYIFNDDFAANTLLSNNDQSSFFSGHTSSAAAASFFTARVFADYYPNSKLKPYVWSMAAAIPALTGYLRVRAGKHYPSDVLVGYIVGGVIGYLVPTLHKRRIEDRKLKLSPSLGGLYLNYNLSR